MSLRIVNNIAPAMLTNASALYYTVPAFAKVRIQKLTLNNTDTAPRTVTIYLVPSGGSASNTNALVLNYPISAGYTLDLQEAAGQTLEAGTSIYALADTGAVVSIRCSALEVVSQ